MTCDSDIPSANASFALSGPARYLVCSKVFSSAKICWPENVGRVCFFFPSRSEPELAPEAGDDCDERPEKISGLNTFYFIRAFNVIRAYIQH